MSINYVGIDIATSMLEKAKEFSETELFSGQSKFTFFTNWDDIDDKFIHQITQNNAFLIFNASYLFASSSLNEVSLANFVNRVVSKLTSNAYFVFQNPDRADRNIKYQNFKKLITLNIVISDSQRIYYRNRQNSFDEPSNELVNFEILSL